MPDLSHLVEQYFSAASLTEPLAGLVVEGVDVEEVGENKERLPVVRFREEKRRLVLNASRYQALTDAAGTRDTDYWPGLYVRLERATFWKRGEEVAYITLFATKEAPCPPADPTNSPD